VEKRHATAVLTTMDRKLSKEPEIRQMSATYASPQSCPKECAFRGAGCYGEAGNVGCHARRLDCGPASPLEIAREEGAHIRALPTDGRPLRVHVVGDSRTPAAAREIASAVGELQARGGGPAFTYSHAWARVPREDWGPVGVLASCERVRDVSRARDRGYPAALVVASFERLPALPAGLRPLRCPEETGAARDCHECRRCIDADGLYRSGSVVIFEARAPARKARATLARLNGGRNDD
jgi:hypothetical protein